MPGERRSQEERSRPDAGGGTLVKAWRLPSLPARLINEYRHVALAAPELIVPLTALPTPASNAFRNHGGAQGTLLGTGQNGPTRGI